MSLGYKFDHSGRVENDVSSEVTPEDKENEEAEEEQVEHMIAISTFHQFSDLKREILKLHE